MKRTPCIFLMVGLVLILPLNLLLAAQDPALSFFTNVRDIHIAQPGVQNYFVVDAEIWGRSRLDLGDLRIYDGQTQVQYALDLERGGVSTHEVPARILNLGTIGGHTEFDLDMGQIGEYDRIRLSLDAKDFISTASLAGSNSVGQRPAAQLPTSTLYDFTREDLGSNSVLKLPTSSFHYLHVSLSPGIAPQQVKGATVYNVQETKASWTEVGSCGIPQQKQRTTLITCQAPLRVPVDRIRFQVERGQVNFHRGVIVTDSNGRQETAGEITRVRLNREGTTVVSEEMDLPIEYQRSGFLTIAIDNGDNPPLAMAAVQLLSIERRVYFDPTGKTLVKLYYGDEKLHGPTYDYARFFNADPAAVKAELGPEGANEAYRERPDDRPWSERHNVVLWITMLLAVAVLAVLAIRGLRGDSGKQPS
jgi:Protein of unknown function (DUF3999)